MLLERIAKDPEFYKSLNRMDEGGEEEDQESDDENGGDGKVCYDEIDSSKTIDEAVTEIIKSNPADSLADIYADKDDGSLSESDAEDRGAGTNLDIYIGSEFSTCNATKGWMEWNSK